jgi:RNA polymerase sigma factor (TIGR02999 family)
LRHRARRVAARRPAEYVAPKMTTPPTSEVSRLLVAWRQGDQRALDLLMPLVYDELRRLAQGQMRGERPDHTLQTTALVHEAYLRLCGADVAWEGRVHFLAVAATVMRRILVDHARSRDRVKRGGGADPVALEEALAVSPQRPEAVIALDEAIERLSALDERKARAVELHFFGGLTYEETAAALGVSAATVDRELRLAKAWLYRELRPGGDDGA